MVNKLIYWYDDHKVEFWIVAITIILLTALWNALLDETSPETKSRRIQHAQELAPMELQLVEIGGCQYVLWHNGYGSDMEHHGQCKGCAE